MKPDELRALADALEPMARAPRFDGFDVPAFCAWVRACADGKPVAWMYEYDGCVDHPVLSTRQWPSYGELWTETPLYAAPAVPQAMEDANVWKQIVPDDEPQAEPKREPLSDSDADYWLRHRQAILDAIRREGFVLMSNACGFWLKRMDRVSEAHGIGGSDAE